MQEEMQVLVDQQRLNADPREAWRRVRGWKRLGRRTLAVLRELAAWRESAARQSDVPPRTFLRDQAIRAAARVLPRTVEELAAVRGFPRPVARRHGRKLVRMMEEVRNMPPESWPPSPPRESRAIPRDLIGRAMTQGQELCRRGHVAHDLFASRSNYIQLAEALKSGEEPPEGARLLTGWRREFAGEEVANVLRAAMKNG